MLLQHWSISCDWFIPLHSTAEHQRGGFLVVQFIPFANQILLLTLPNTWHIFSYANNLEPAAGGDEAAPPHPDIHCRESTADAKPGFDKQTDTKTTLGWFVQSNRHGETLTWRLLRLFKAKAACIKKRNILISQHVWCCSYSLWMRAKPPPSPPGQRETERDRDGSLSDIIYGLQTSQQIVCKIPTVGFS